MNNGISTNKDIENRIKIAKVITVFKKTCNDKQDIETVEKLRSDFGLDFSLDVKDLEKKLFTYSSDDLIKIRNILVPTISTKIEAQIKPESVCIDQNNLPKPHCLDKTRIEELSDIPPKKCPTVPGPAATPAPPTAPPTAPSATTDNSTVPAVASVGGKKSKRRKHRRRNNRRTKKQRKYKRR